MCLEYEGAFEALWCYCCTINFRTGITELENTNEYDRISYFFSIFFNV
jgi:hypothetical protein